MKKTFIILMLCLAMPLSLFASNKDVVVEDGADTVNVAHPCGTVGSGDD
ncbi:MAG: hypothetical protein HRT87_06290 [Legionellales bacterium]|nr:hypothetical protein [Legionellales bacterium]